MFRHMHLAAGYHPEIKKERKDVWAYSAGIKPAMFRLEVDCINLLPHRRTHTCTHAYFEVNTQRTSQNRILEEVGYLCEMASVAMAASQTS